MKREVHEAVFRYIDRGLCYPGFNYDKHPIKPNWYYCIDFLCSEKNPGELIRIFAKEKGSFRPGRIVIHRFDYGVPNVSFLDEAITILHEYGHSLSLKNGKEERVAETGYSYREEDKTRSQAKFLILREELNAWKHAFKSILDFPIPFVNKIELFCSAILKAPFALASYIS